MKFAGRFEVCALALTLALGTMSAQAQINDPAPLKAIAMRAANGSRSFASEHTGTFNGHRVTYRATVAETLINDADGTPLSDFFSTAYTVEGSDAKTRPVTFIFNGGPGASSSLLHLLSLGPKIVADATPEGFRDVDNRLVDNPQSPLDATDMVFIDPTETGFSRSASTAAKKRLYSIEGDAESVAVFISGWLASHNRTQSPVYIYGESYGSLRATVVTRDLARTSPAVHLSGLALGGFALSYGLDRRLPNPVSIANQLPGMASVAWLKGKIDNKGQTWQQAVEKAKAFARTEYVGALMMGDELDPATRQTVVSHLPAIIGIPQSYFDKNHTIMVKDFHTELLRDEGLVLDRNNGEWTSKPDGAPESYAGVEAVMNKYMTADLKVSGLGHYVSNASMRDPAWDYSLTGSPTIPIIYGEDFKNNPAMRGLVMQGRFDTLTPLGPTEYVLRTAVPKDRVKLVFFKGGHLLMPDPAALKAIHAFVSGG